ncbi:MAG TPA: DUF4435 domain-containing protein [Pseudomonadota bacterium]|nr:DUF4435 domain-containing protein [Pseudomonadota bacterium]
MSVHEQFGVRRPGLLVESKLFNAARPTVTLLVEAGFDERFWRMHVAPSCIVRHQDQGGRAAAIAKLDEAPSHPDAVFLAVLDADLDRLEGRLSERGDIVWTDANDLEATLVFLPALKKLVLMKLDPTVLRDKQQAWGESIMERLVRHACGMGRLRWYKQRALISDIVFVKSGKGTHKGSLRRFDKYQDCCDNDWSPSLGHLVDAIINYSNAQFLNKSALIEGIQGLPDTAPKQICNGHDLVGFLLSWLTSLSRSYVGNAEQLSDELALACERTWLEATDMWAAIKAWEARHPGHLILRQPEHFEKKSESDAVQ